MRGLLRPLADLGRFAPGRPRPRRRLVVIQLDGVGDPLDDAPAP